MALGAAILKHAVSIQCGVTRVVLTCAATRLLGSDGSSSLSTPLRPLVTFCLALHITVALTVYRRFALCNTPSQLSLCITVPLHMTLPLALDLFLRPSLSCSVDISTSLLCSAFRGAPTYYLTMNEKK